MFLNPYHYYFDAVHNKINLVSSPQSGSCKVRRNLFLVVCCDIVVEAAIKNLLAHFLEWTRVGLQILGNGRTRILAEFRRVLKKKKEEKKGNGEKLVAHERAE